MLIFNSIGNKINRVIRCLISVSDYEYELQLSLTNRAFADFDLETVFIPECLINIIEKRVKKL